MSQKSADQPTKPELAILKLLWRDGEQSARDLHGEIAAQFSWSYSTVRTVLDRMTEKGLVAKRAHGQVNLYAARASKVSMLSRMIADFSSRVLELDAPPAAAFFADSKLLTEDELDELEALLSGTEDKS